MKSGQFGKIIIAVLLASLAAVLSSLVSQAVYVVNYQESAFDVEGVEEPDVDLAALRRDWPQGLEGREDRARLISHMSELEPAEGEEAEGGEAEAPEQVLPLSERLAQADVAHGEQLAAQCQACHSLEEGGAVRLGPTLYGVAGRPVGSYAGFEYSDVMAGHGGDWTLEELDMFLADPMGTMPGTRMIFVGVPQQQDRADVIAYLNTLTNTPLPMPEPEEADENEDEEE
jgi:cytochrome c